MSALSASSPLRIFAFSALISLVALLAIGLELGALAVMTAVILSVIEVTFSFDNAIINARVLKTMSKFWQQMFLSVGILIAIFGTRLVFPILIVMLATGLSWGEVTNLALNKPEIYSRELDHAHVAISAFGGFFLLMLGLRFFLDEHKKIHWFKKPEAWAARISRPPLYALIVSLLLLILWALPFNHHAQQTLIAGAVGIGLYLAIHGLSDYFSGNKSLTSGVNKAGWAGFMAFLYLEVLDASFSLDSVVGAFAITNKVLLIAAGLGIGAVWVRSLTVFVVRRNSLQSYKFLEHGAYYTILMLAFVLLLGIFVNLPQAAAGLVGVVIIGAAIWSSRRSVKATTRQVST